MKKRGMMLTATLMICALAGVAALAQGKTHTVTFYQDTLVNQTLVKKGEYQMRFDEQTGELSVLKDRKVVATAKAEAQTLDHKAPDTMMDLTEKEGSHLLTQITFGGERRTLIIGGGPQSAEQQ